MFLEYGLFKVEKKFVFGEVRTHEPSGYDPAAMPTALPTALENFDLENVISNLGLFYFKKKIHSICQKK